VREEKAKADFDNKEGLFVSTRIASRQSKREKKKGQAKEGKGSYQDHIQKYRTFPSKGIGIQK